VASRRTRKYRRRNAVPRTPSKLAGTGGCQANVGTERDVVHCNEMAVTHVVVDGENVYLCAGHGKTWKDWERRQEGKSRVVQAIVGQQKDAAAAARRRETEERLGVR
jgi:hypothetical protein